MIVKKNTMLWCQASVNKKAYTLRIILMEIKTAYIYIYIYDISSKEDSSLFVNI